MSDNLTIPLNVLLGRLASVASQDKELIAVLRRAAEDFLRLTEPPAKPALPAIPIIEDETATEPIITRDDISPPVVAPPQHVSLPQRPGIEIPTAWFRRLLSEENSLQLIEGRCRLKAEGARWAAAASPNPGRSQLRRRDRAENREIIAKAQTLENCFLWMNHLTAPVPVDLQCWEDVAGCFEAAGIAVGLLRQIIEMEMITEDFLKRRLI